MIAQERHVRTLPAREAHALIGDPLPPPRDQDESEFLDWLTGELEDGRWHSVKP